MEEDELPRGVAVDVLDLELRVEFLRDLLLLAPVLRREDVCELGVPCRWVGVGLALLPESVRCEDLSLREGFLPGCDEDVVLHVRGGDVLEFPAKGCDCLFDFGSEGDR